MLQKAKPKRKSLIDIGQEYTNKILKLSRLLIDTKYSRIGKAVIDIIPVLSIFALLGINIMLFGAFYDEVPETYAAGSVGSGTSASLIIDNGAVVDRISAAHGETAYASHVVKVSANNITDYALTITGPTNLTGTTSIGGAGGKVGSSMNDDTWGYAWDVASKAEADMTYNSFTGAAQTLNGNPGVTNNTVEFERKLAFAAKFSQDAMEGHYTASVNLNLVATPYIVVLGFGGIEKMQDMTPEICASAPEGLVGQLYDTRDNNTYLIQKVSSRCWMTQNLSLAGGTKITSADSDVVSDYTMKDSTSDNFTDDNTSDQMRNADNSTYGAYYSWCAATANTCDSVASGADAASSICPKGWQLPKGGTGTTNDFAVALGYTAPVSGNPNIWSSISPTPTIINNSLMANGVTWAANGYVSKNGLGLPGSVGRYWSRTALDTAKAYLLSFDGSSLLPAGTDLRYIGFSVRCVAEEPEQKYTYTITFDKNSSYSVRNVPSPVTCSSLIESCITTLPSQRPYMSCEDNTTIKDFSSWREKDSGGNWTGKAYQPGDTITITKDTTLYIDYAYSFGDCA